MSPQGRTETVIPRPHSIAGPLHRLHLPYTLIATKT